MERQIPDTLMYVIEHWFSIGRTGVKWDNVFSRYFNLSCGVRQGGVLSPYLFAIYEPYRTKHDQVRILRFLTFLPLLDTV